MKMRFLFCGLTLVLLVALREAAGERMIWSREEMVEMAGYGELRLSSVLLTATLLSSSTSSPIPGATVGIKCSNGLRRRSKWIKGVTNEMGEFVIDLPSHLHAIPDLDKACFIKLLSIPRPFQCSPRIHRGIQLISSSEGLRVYTAGNITLHRAPCIKRF